MSAQPFLSPKDNGQAPTLTPFQSRGDFLANGLTTLSDRLPVSTPAQRHGLGNAFSDNPSAPPRVRLATQNVTRDVGAGTGSLIWLITGPHRPRAIRPYTMVSPEVVNSYAAENLRDHLWRHMDRNDRLFVGETQGWAGMNLMFDPNSF